MQKPSEERQAIRAYNWLRASPFLTIPTLLLISSLDLGQSFCDNFLSACNYEFVSYLNYTFGVLGSSLWHVVILFQYANNKDSAFVRRHGQQALIYAGIRTAVPVIAIVLDYFSSTSGALACVAILILMMLWFSQTKIGLERVKRELEEDSDVTRDEANTGTQEAFTLPSQEVIRTEVNMSENQSQTAEEILNEILILLMSKKEEDRAAGIARLNDITFSSEAIRRELETIARKDENQSIRANALAALNLPANRMVRRRITSNKLDRGIRNVLLKEINEWEKSGLLERRNAELIRRRYDFDFEPSPIVQDKPPRTAPQPFGSAQDKPEAKAPETGTAVPMERREPVPEGPRPSLLQTLTSEASIKIYLYLGAFFVIASAAIIGAAIPELRLPILILGTFIFGGLAVAIKKRLPQPSFALFIVFSFLLPITANTIAGTFNLIGTLNAGFWTAVFLVMAGVWSASTWLYESRLFSITAFGSLTLALLRIGDLFEAQTEFFTAMAGIAALAGLGGVWLAKKWKDETFALPLFLSAQLVQGGTLIASIAVFAIHVVEPSNPSLWHLAAFFVWGCALAFFSLSNRLYPFFLFPWLAAGTLVPMPWFLAAAFDLESLGSTIVLFLWGALLGAASEALHRFETVRRYSLPVLLASMPALALGIITGFAYETWLGLLASLGFAVLYAALHVLRTRWWLWTLALLGFVVSYFAFFNLEFMQKLNVFMGYQVLGISLILLLPDLLLKKDWRDNPAWRLPPRIYGALFIAVTSIALPLQEESGHLAVFYLVLAVFFTIYALAYRNALLGYLPAAYLPLGIIFALDAFDADVWLPVLTALAVLYFAGGIALRAKEGWTFTLRNSALALGALVSLAALVLTKETGGWYALVIGLLFAAEMYLRRSGWFEPGAPILFSIGAFLILHDLDVTRATHHLLTYSLIWLIADLLAHLTFPHPRPLKWGVRSFGGLLALMNYILLFAESDASITASGFTVYTLLFLTVSLLYRQPQLLYAFTATLPLFITFLFRTFDVTQWIHPVMFVAVMYYAVGFILRAMKHAEGWEASLLYSGLGLGLIVSIGAPFPGGLAAAIPVAAAATLWAVEAFAKKNAWLAFPANGLYLLAYFIILFELKVDEPQFFSVGAALLGLIQHYLLTRAGGKTGAYIMGMVSQFVLLGTTYIEMVNKNELAYFFVLFFQSLAVLIYGLVIRSRSLTFFPIGFVVLGVLTVVYSALQGVMTIFLIGCTGLLLLAFGIIAVLMRERIAKLNEKLSDWKA